VKFWKGSDKIGSIKTYIPKTTKRKEIIDNWRFKALGNTNEIEIISKTIGLYGKRIIVSDDNDLIHINDTDFDFDFVVPEVSIGNLAILDSLHIVMPDAVHFNELMVIPEMNDFNFRKRQLEKLKVEVIDIEEASENISLTDLNMNEYLYELSQYVTKTPEIKKIPKGVYSVADGQQEGVLFCFKHSNHGDKPKSDSSLYPYYLIYIDNDGEILYGNAQAREVLKLFRKLCYGKSEPMRELLDDFIERTKNTTDMTVYSEILTKAIASIKGQEEEKAIQTVFDFGGFDNTFEDESIDDFELISFLVVQ
jgi:hypothetical protein